MIVSDLPYFVIYSDGEPKFERILDIKPDTIIQVDTNYFGLEDNKLFAINIGEYCETEILNFPMLNVSNHLLRYRRRLFRTMLRQICC